MDLASIIKGVIIDYIKSHNETSGKVIELLDHINETAQCAQSLPVVVQAELRQLLLAALVANGISANFNR